MLFWGTLLSVLYVCAAQRYPITAAWFSDHLSRDNWNETLTNFTKSGGDTVLVKAPQFQFRSQQEMEADPDFAWCGTTATNTGPTCFADAKKEMNQLGLNIASFAFYKSGENFSDAIVACPAFEKKLVQAKTYFRLVLPITVRPQSKPRDQCLFTSFAGVDSNKLSVYLGIPEAPDTLPNHQYMGAYYEWFSRLLVDHQQRYSGIVLRKSKYKTAYDAVTGYNSGDALPLGECSTAKDALILSSTQGNTVHHHGKKFLRFCLC
ncbi:hypothetical protein KP79_PYT07473 [Mizuhopecten yessoensis]|uniref:Uncharacterized protein n=1 Tax=Mizuhopecten yessoensis TaxID=6573 RepID=A0A210QQF3_MIZYE|nr:hypothetical protein KP79_PYT07473 [Mizuhopecten yessoensis]